MRALACKRLKEQLTLPRNRKKPTIFDATPHNARCEKNVVCMQRNLQDSNVLVAVSGRDLQALDGTPATPEQQRDLIAFRDIGQQYYEAYVKYYIQCQGFPPKETPAHLLCSEAI